MSETSTQALTCPKCGGQMRAYERSGITVDQCRDCRGIFLDRGELERLMDAEDAHYTAGQRPQATPPPYRPQAPYPPQQEWRGDYDDDRGGHHDDDRGGHQGGRKGKRRGGFLGELFD